MNVEEAEQVELTVGAVAPGGHCVARHDGQVIFVRHALPGERVLAEITEVHTGFLRADAVRVHRGLARPGRTALPVRPSGRAAAAATCSTSRPTAQLRWKADVVREQLVRLAGLPEPEIDALGVRVEALPGGTLGWRSRVRYAVDAADRAGLLKHRSHEVVPVDRCLIAHPAIQELPVLSGSGARWPQAEAVATVASSTGEVTVSTLADGTATVVRGQDEVHEEAAGRRWQVPAEAFWQVHPAAADTLTDDGPDDARARRGGAGLGPLRRRRALRRRAGRPGRADRPGDPGGVRRSRA